MPAAYTRELVTSLWGDLIVASPNNRYEIRAFRADGTLARIVRREHVPRIPSDADKQFLVDREVASRDSPDIPDELLEEVRRVFGSVPVAEIFPAFSAILADDADHLWVREYEFAGRTPRPSLDRLRSGRACVRVLRDTQGPARSPDRRRLHTGPLPGRTRRRICAGVAAGAVGGLKPRGRLTRVLESPTPRRSKGGLQALPAQDFGETVLRRPERDREPVNEVETLRYPSSCGVGKSEGPRSPCRM